VTQDRLSPPIPTFGSESFPTSELGSEHSCLQIFALLQPRAQLTPSTTTDLRPSRHSTTMPTTRSMRHEFLRHPTEFASLPHDTGEGHIDHVEDEVTTSIEHSPEGQRAMEGSTHTCTINKACYPEIYQMQAEFWEDDMMASQLFVGLVSRGHDKAVALAHCRTPFKNVGMTRPEFRAWSIAGCNRPVSNNEEGSSKGRNLKYEAPTEGQTSQNLEYENPIKGGQDQEQDSSTLPNGFFDADEMDLDECLSQYIKLDGVNDGQASPGRMSLDPEEGRNALTTRTPNASQPTEGDADLLSEMDPPQHELKQAFSDLQKKYEMLEESSNAQIAALEGQIETLEDQIFSGLRYPSLKSLE
jgi:hypothetical protein